MSEDRDILPFMQSLTLVDVYYDSHGFRRLEEDEEGEEDDARIVVLRRLEEGELIVGFDVNVTSGRVVLETKPVARYQLDDTDLLTPDIERTFIHRSALATLAPFAREGVMSLAARARVPIPLLPLVGAGVETVERVDSSPAEDREGQDES